MAVIADVGNVDYYIRRARESLSADPPNVKQAISLLALVLVETERQENHGKAKISSVGDEPKHRGRKVIQGAGGAQLQQEAANGGSSYDRPTGAGGSTGTGSSDRRNDGILERRLPDHKYDG